MAEETEAEWGWASLGLAPEALPLPLVAALASTTHTCEASPHTGGRLWGSGWGLAGIFKTLSWAWGCHVALRHSGRDRESLRGRLVST